MSSLTQGGRFREGIWGCEGQKRILTLSLDVGDPGRLKGRLPAQQEVS